jgi:UDP-N-acetylmuramoyl-tripeptide--D-alanyl-D-alanine ligase
MTIQENQTDWPLIRGEELALWSGGVWDGGAADVRGVTQDGRHMIPGGLYVALKGENHDGHAYVLQAQQGGAAAALVRHDWPRAEGVAIPLLRVAETRSALGLAAAGRRRALHTFVLGITGSVGKTTTKELAAAVFSGAGLTHATHGNLNNDIGLPLTLLAMPVETRVGVIEAGTNHPGEIAYLCRILKPDAAIITAVGPVHLAHFGSEAAIADEKAELIRSVPERGFAVIDADGAHAPYLRAQAACRIISVRMDDSGEADYLGSLVDADGGVVRVCERTSGESQVLRSGLVGRHNAINLLLTVAAGRATGMTWEAIERGLARLAMPSMRWQRTEVDGLVSINDAYNANPPAMRCALDTFAQTAAAARRVVVLGDMRELGEASESFHRELGRWVAAGPWGLVVAVGQDARWIAEEAVAAGFPAGAVRHFADTAAAAIGIRDLLKPGDTLLFKASRGMELERVEAAALAGRSGCGKRRD